jgi:tetratricopeptide (TPR) repeat protein
MEKGKTKASLQFWDKVIEIKPDETSWLMKSLALSKLERFENALEAANKALEIDPNPTLHP